jgi:hypothetical protein
VIAGAVGIFAYTRSAVASTVAYVAAGVAALLAIFLAFNHRRKVLGTYQRQLSPKRAEFSQTLEQQFAKAINAFCTEMAKKLQELRQICQRGLERYQPWSQRVEELQAKLNDMKPRLG